MASETVEKLLAAADKAKNSAYKKASPLDMSDAERCALLLTPDGRGLKDKRAALAALLDSLRT